MVSGCEVVVHKDIHVRLLLVSDCEITVHEEIRMRSQPTTSECEVVAYEALA